MDERATRMVQNETVFREVNEQIAAVDERLGRDQPEQPTEIVCECGRSDCMERIVVTRAEYDEVRADPTRFFIVPGHAEASVERIVGGTDAYQVIEKLPGEPAKVAVDTDPRA